MEKSHLLLTFFIILIRHYTYLRRNLARQNSLNLIMVHKIEKNICICIGKHYKNKKELKTDKIDETMVKRFNTGIKCSLLIP